MWVFQTATWLISSHRWVCLEGGTLEGHAETTCTLVWCSFGFGVVVLCSRAVTVVFVVTLALDWQVQLQDGASCPLYVEIVVQVRLLGSVCGCGENIAIYHLNLAPQALELPVTVMCAHNLIAGVPFGITAAYKPMPTPIGEVNFEHLYKFMADIVSQVKADLKKIGAWDSACLRSLLFVLNNANEFAPVRGRVFSRYGRQVFRQFQQESCLSRIAILECVRVSV